MRYGWSWSGSRQRGRGRASKRRLPEGWLVVRALGDRRWASLMENVVDAGEAEAIALAAEMEADVLLMDEKEGRALARQAGIAVRVVLGFCCARRQVAR